MRIRKTDSNHSTLLEQIRKIPGTSAFSTHAVGDGFPDVVMGFRKMNYLLEIKDPLKPKSQRKLTKDQVIFHDSWMGAVHVIETIDDVLKIINLKK